MYRIRLYIVPEQDEQISDRDKFDEHWFENSVTVTHKNRRGHVITLGEDRIRKERNEWNNRNDRHEVI